MMQSSRLLSVVVCCTLLAGCAAAPPAEAPAAAGARVVPSDDGLSELTASADWEVRPNLGRRAELRLSHISEDAYLVVNTYLPDASAEQTFDALAERVNGAMIEHLDGARSAQARDLTIGGLPAVEQAFSGRQGQLELVYYSVLVNGHKARYHLLGWAPAGSNTAVLRTLISTFRESALPRPPRPRIGLRFDWPAPLQATASFLRKTSNRHGRLEVRGEYAMAVRPVGSEQLLVSTRLLRQDVKTQEAGTQDDPQAQLNNLLTVALTDVPDYLVNRDGEFVRIEHLEAYDQRIQGAVLAGWPKGDAPAQARAQQRVRAMVTEERLSAALQDEWNSTVGLWADGAYVPGERYEFTQPYYATALGGRRFPMVTTQRLAGRVPCRPNDAPDTCVRLLQTMRVANADFTAAMDAQVRKTLGEGARVRHVEVVRSVELIADPATLLPYFKFGKETRRVLVEAAGRRTLDEDVNETEVSYRY